ncbi:tyrosine-type recombinase/integrase [Pseudomonas fulva]|uniref:tyrosine-type recombinase/integrase n=1 Tax=Pseudomonas fulva TaxID=47880 RepID=UPI003D2EAEDD
MIEDSPDGESLERILAEGLDIDFDEDLQGEVEQELEQFLIEATGDTLPTESTLLKKLELFPDGGFPVSPYSNYGDSTWILFKDEDGTVTRVMFDNIPEPIASIKKSIIYHLIPDFSPFGGIRAYSTTRGHSQKFSCMVDYVLLDNHLTGDSESLSFITPKLLNNALDKARESSRVTHYYYTFMHIRLWISLSIQQLIPLENRISISANAIDTPERRKEVIRHFSGAITSWIPFTEPELKKLIGYASFWTEKAMPCLQGVADYVHGTGLLNNGTLTAYSSGKEDPELLRNLKAEIDGVDITKVSVNVNHSRKGVKWSYSWYNSALQSLDSIRCAIYILVALVTGLRVGELRALKFEHVIRGDDGRFKLQVTRWKTSKDPNYKGDTSFIPLPRFVGEKVREYERLRRMLRAFREGYLFQSVLGTKTVNRDASNKIVVITQKLEAALQIDRIHTHRFRKTIAEILINRSERNVDIIRFLFGHASYAMTLRYIGRNPYIVKSVVQAIEQNYIEEFTDLISSVKTSGSSGESAKRLLERIAARPEAFIGKQLQVTIFTYVTHLLSSGEPLFIHRTAVGTYCVSTAVYSSPDLPPCLAHHNTIIKDALPDPQFCNPTCKHALIVEKAARALADNVTFYEQMLTRANATLSENSKKLLRQKILENSKQLEELRTNQSYKIIPTVDVQA